MPSHWAYPWKTRSVEVYIHSKLGNLECLLSSLFCDLGLLSTTVGVCAYTTYTYMCMHSYMSSLTIFFTNLNYHQVCYRIVCSHRLKPNLLYTHANRQPKLTSPLRQHHCFLLHVAGQTLNTDVTCCMQSGKCLEQVPLHCFRLWANLTDLSW